MSKCENLAIASGPTYFPPALCRLIGESLVVSPKTGEPTRHRECPFIQTTDVYCNITEEKPQVSSAILPPQKEALIG